MGPVLFEWSCALWRCAALVQAAISENVLRPWLWWWQQAASSVTCDRACRRHLLAQPSRSRREAELLVLLQMAVLEEGPPTPACCKLTQSSTPATPARN